MILTDLLFIVICMTKQLYFYHDISRWCLSNSESIDLQVYRYELQDIMISCSFITCIHNMVLTKNFLYRCLSDRILFVSS